jgi:hypothetical protein
VPQGTEVTVTGATGGWLRVRLTLNGKPATGYISQELVGYVRPVELSLREALVLLKRAETQRETKGVGNKPPQDEEGWLSLALGVVNGNGKYTAHAQTYAVAFKSNSQRIKIETIEDFILFVEEVERQYPSAGPATIATEIRQVWFSDENWEMLSAGMGVESGGVFEDIETRPNPIALKFDMGDMSPSKADLAAGKKSKRLATAMGTVDISHVIAGLDTRLNGFPAAYPADHLKRRNHDSDDARLKYRTLSAASAGNSRDFATWSGDIGQAYAEFLVARYVRNEKRTLAQAAQDSADDDALLGDIHGYIAMDVWKSVPATESPTGEEKKVSNILRDLYLVSIDKSKKGARYQKFFEEASGKKASELRAFITERSLAFARPWFAKMAVAHRGAWGSKGWTRQSILDNGMAEFDTTHAKRECPAEETL